MDRNCHKTYESPFKIYKYMTKNIDLIISEKIIQVKIKNNIDLVI